MAYGSIRKNGRHSRAGGNLKAYGITVPCHLLLWINHSSTPTNAEAIIKGRAGNDATQWFVGTRTTESGKTAP